MKTPEERIEIIETSLRCFRRSLWSIIPIIGIVPAVSALFCHRRVRRLAGKEWNPAKAHLIWGAVISWLTLGKNALTMVWVFMVVYGECGRILSQ